MHGLLLAWHGHVLALLMCLEGCARQALRTPIAGQEALRSPARAEQVTSDCSVGLFHRDARLSVVD
eukprot:1800244-Alexandrium_andersonii.AAC.1